MSVIQLTPMRMSEIPSTTSSDMKKSGKYMPPNLRGSHISKAVEVAVDMSTMDAQNFPSLGSAPKKTIAWGKHVIRTQAPPGIQAPKEVQVKKETLSDKIQEKLRQDALDDEEKARPPETDILRMSERDLVKEGWDILTLGKDASYPTTPLYNKFPNAPLGMSFYDYTYYLSQRPVMKISRKTLPNTPTTIEEIYEDESDYEDSSSFETKRNCHEIW